jgi:hypothetical protein
LLGGPIQRVGRRPSPEGVVGVTAMVALTCAAHLEPGPNGPLVTTIDGLWAYCLGGGEKNHDWRKIEPTALEHLRSGRHRSEIPSRTKR